MSKPRTLLHVFSTFNVGGPQIRFAQLANHFGPLYRHRIVAMDGATAAMARLGSGLDAELIEVPVHKGGTVKNLGAFRRVLSRVRPDLLVTSNWGTIEWAMANLDHRTPHLHMEDGFGPEEAQRQLPRRVWTRRLVLPGSTVLLPSRTLLRIATEVWKLPRRNLIYVPNGIDCARFAHAPDQTLASRFGIRNYVPVIGSIGGLRAEKNLLRLLSAFAIVLRSRPAQLVIVGNGPLAEELKSAAEARGLSDNVVFTGASSVPERLLALFWVYALSSDTEQMPLSVLEAMAGGRAIASTDVGDVRAMVSEENRPFVVEPNAERLAGAILELIEDPARAASIGNANRERAFAKYDQSRMFAAYRRLFDGDLTGQDGAEGIAEPGPGNANIKKVS
jgi:glycosyltransferase involved in cell wall biosynthesis